MANGENAMMGFIEEKNRVVVDGYCAQTICSFAQSIWFGLLKISKAPQTWGLAGLKASANTGKRFMNRLHQLILYIPFSVITYSTLSGTPSQLPPSSHHSVPSPTPHSPSLT
jgi:hypothetical protein